MGEDKLSHAQRVRLESFAQAMSSAMAVRLNPPINAPAVAGRIGNDPGATMTDLFKRAEEIEAWIWQAQEPTK